MSIANTYTYSRGQWQDGHSLPELRDDEDTPAYLDRIGYSDPRISFGTEYGLQIQLYECRTDLRFLAVVWPTGNQSAEVFLPDLPSLMMFIRDHGAAFCTHALTARQDEAERAELERLDKLRR
jgi:hypothetical protein